MKTIKKRSLSQKQKLSSQDRPDKVKKLQTLTIAKLENISGSGLDYNHNETVFSFSNRSNTNFQKSLET